MYECMKCEKEFEIPEDERFGGEMECPVCKAKYDLSFDTFTGLAVQLTSE